MSTKVKKQNDVPNVTNANEKSVPIVGTIEIVIQIGTSTRIVNFIVVENLTTSVILGCEFFDVHVEAIKTKQMVVEIDAGSTVPHHLTTVETEYESTAPGRKRVQLARKACTNQNKNYETSSSQTHNPSLGRSIRQDHWNDRRRPLYDV